MAHVQRSVASIRFAGDALNPEALSADLGCSPTLSYAKGDVRPKKRGAVVWQSGMWLLEAKLCEPENLDAQVEGLLISADTLRALGKRGVKLSMCVYAPGGA